MTEATKTVYSNYYLCPCGEEWSGEHDAACNDRCPACRKEIEPFITEDGSVTAEQMGIAREATLAKLGLCRCADCGDICPEDDLDGIVRLSQRLLPGDDVPDGQCPECGALSYRVKVQEHLFIVLHQHEFGTSAHLALATREPTTEEAIKAFEINFEPEKEDFLEIVVAGAPVRIEVAA